MRHKEDGYLVTGGGSGIGEATAEMLINRGARVTICGRRADVIARVADRLGDRCLAVQADVTVKEDQERVVEAAMRHGREIKGLINNAGNMYRASVEEYDADQLLDIFNQNVVAGMMLSRWALPSLKATKGSIVFLGSVHTRRAFPGVSPYAATKAALQGLTQVMAAELGPAGVRVNCVIPGAVPSDINLRAGVGTLPELEERFRRLAPMHALGRVGDGQDVAEAIGYLLEATWTTGTLLTVDGGLSLGATTV
jgi:3-oxoacyl-[acyl-carrier protein] reductase